MDPWYPYKLQNSSPPSSTSCYAHTNPQSSTFCNIVDGHYNLDLNQIFNCNTNQRTSQGTHEVIVAKTGLCKSDGKFG